jgi:hypothetical protein
MTLRMRLPSRVPRFLSSTILVDWKLAPQTHWIKQRPLSWTGQAGDACETSSILFGQSPYSSRTMDTNTEVARYCIPTDSSRPISEAEREFLQSGIGEGLFEISLFQL